jgi:anti-sigma B factor antagonist
MDINTVVREKNISILRIDGKIIGESSNTLKREIDKQIRNGAVKIILDLSEVPLMDSSALGIIVAALTSLKKKDMKLVLLKPQKAVSDVLRITRLDTIFEIYDDEQKTIRTFDE